MSVLARKIAVANQPPPERPDADKLALSILPQMCRTLTGWMSLEQLDLEVIEADWIQPKPDIFDGPVIGAQGRRRSQRALVSLNSALADRAALDLLCIDTLPAGEDLAALRPFVQENMVSLGERLNDTAMGQAAGEPEWGAADPEAVHVEFAPYDTVMIRFAVKDGGVADLQVRLFLTEDMFSIVQTDDAPEPDPVVLPPRLGPCHVEIRAVGDRVELSVADCTRLEIGQVIGLPGLRFDKLELDVEMGDGPLPLTDAALGADKGRKAVRLNRGLDPDFRAPPADAAVPAPSGEAVPA